MYSKNNQARPLLYAAASKYVLYIFQYGFKRVRSLICLRRKNEEKEKSLLVVLNNIFRVVSFN